MSAPPDSVPAAFEQVLEVVRAAAGDAIAVGAARLEATAPVVRLTPSNPRAAELVVEVDDPRSWWVWAGDGPAFEFYEGDEGDWLERLGAMVTSVVAGRYEDEWGERRRRRLLRPWSHRVIDEWVATFHTAHGPIRTWHIGPARPAAAPARRRFEAY